MTCEEIEAGELAEKYVLGQLGAGDQAAYEIHYFHCAHCFEELQLRQSLQTQLSTMAARKPVRSAATRSTRWMVWGAAAAAVALVAGAGIWRLARPPAAARPAQAAHRQRESGQNGPSIYLLARVEPPPYTPPALRGAARQDPQFRDAMEKYRLGNFDQAIPGLLAAAQVDPEAADPQFFLGICYLMDGRNEEAITHLRRTIELGTSLDLEMAHFYLAKALLREKETAGASAELEAAVALHGDLEKPSRELLQQLKNLRE